MRGQVLGVDRRTGRGQVAGEDGRRYSFGPADWAARGEPSVGALVDFAAEEDRALSLFPLPAAGPRALAEPAGPPPPAAAGGERNRFVAALLACFLGLLGVHRFYVGRIGSGIVMLVLTVTVIGTLVTLPWSLVDMLRYLLMSDQGFARRYGRG